MRAVSLDRSLLRTAAGDIFEADPCRTLHAAAQLGFREIEWPKRYPAGKAQLERNLARAAQMALAA